MRAAEYTQMAAVQDDHWWFEAKRRVVAALLERHGVAPAAASAESRVLEVGAGTGSMVPVMARHGRMFAADAYLPALSHLAGRSRPDAVVLPVGADLSRLPFSERSFSLVGCFDVLYHQGVADVAVALAELHRVCRPQGHLVITDSAFPLLRSSHDVATHAARRFRLAELVDPLREAGFSINHATYFHAMLFPVAAAVRLSKRILEGAPSLDSSHDPDGRRRPHGQGGPMDARRIGRTGDADGPDVGDESGVRSDLTPSPAWLNAILLSLYRIEIPVAVRFRLPAGVSLLILAQRRD